MICQFLLLCVQAIILFEYHRQFRVASCDLGAILGKEYSDVQNNLVTGILEKAKIKIIEILTKSRSWSIRYTLDKSHKRNMI